MVVRGNCRTPGLRPYLSFAIATGDQEEFLPLPFSRLAANAMDECKPDSVSRRNGKTTIHLSSRYPELLHPFAGTLRHGPRLIPYLALHREGFALLPALPGWHGGLLHRLFTLAACAAVCFLWHFPFPRIAPGHPTFQSGSLPCGVRTFLPLRSGRPSPITPYNVISKPPFAIRLGEINR